MTRVHKRWLAPVVLLVIGIVVVVAGSSTRVDIAGGAIIAVAFTLAVSLAFLEVGLSEDRARASSCEYGPPPGR